MSERTVFPNPGLPKSPNDKFLWRKMFDHNPEFTRLSDKLEVRNWLAEVCPEIEAPKVHWVGTDAADIPDDILANGVVVKANHASGTNILVPDAPEDRAALNALANSFLDRNHGTGKKEWAYQDIPRKLFAEDFLGTDLSEFKIMMFDQEPGRVALVYGRFSDGFNGDIWDYDSNGVLKPSKYTYDSIEPANLPLPSMFETALDLSTKLSKGFDHVRVDLAWDGTHLFFSEMTFYNIAGQVPHIGHRADNAIARLWDIRKSWFLTTEHSGWRGIYARALRRELDRLT